ncbi:oxidoreductase [Ascochyta rabiei]|uniref:Oxidoreductase n=1 Tax=Didymella rabiei TaxID=5454 RepID=A0A163AQA4_DIDRA|nr:oxidoreductase [Ascochyta rabiei]
MNWPYHILELSPKQKSDRHYFHLTKRFGIVGTSQLPILYLLSLKRLNPVAYAFHMSHETVNQWHRILGRIVYLLVTLHGGLYINFYIRSSSFGNAFFRAVPVLGILALTGITVLNTAAISMIRRYSYRVFFFTHIIVAFALPPIIWFHVPYSRAFVAESFVLLVLDLFLRSFSTVQSLATVEKVPGTDLVKIVAKVPSKCWAHFATHPASHAYLSIPARSGTIREPLLSPLLRYGFLLNPFTVASVREGTRKLTFVMRVKNGPLTKSFDHLTSQDEHTGSTKVIVRIDGPYGATSKFSILESSSFDYILLVAGGVGATFIMPLYERLIANNVSAEVKVVWAVQNANETSWPILSTQESIYNDPRVDIYTTGTKLDLDANDSGSGSHIEDVEMNIWKDGRSVPVGDRQRPDFQRIVDQIFVKNHYKRIAVVVCGPVPMSQDLRQAVGVWVKKSKDIWFHSESFGL